MDPTNNRSIEIGDHYFRSQRFDEAISVFSKMLPGTSDVHGLAMLYIRIGYCYMQKGHESALDYFDAALKKEPENKEAKSLKERLLNKKNREREQIRKTTNQFWKKWSLYFNN